MRHHLSSAARAFLLTGALLLGACDSLPGALEPDVGADGSIPVGQARLVVRNTGTRTVTGYSGGTCSTAVNVIRYQRVTIAPNGQHAVNSSAGCVGVSVDFSSGSGWFSQVQLRTGETATLTVR
jgi:hypothetical protein